MKISYLLPQKIGKLMSVTFLLIFLGTYTMHLHAQIDDPLIEIDGLVVNITTGEPIIAASIEEVNSNSSTITNTEGAFSLKISNPESIFLKIDALGFKPKTIIVSKDNAKNLRITLQVSSIELTEVSITSYKSARDLVNKVFENKRSNYLDDKTLMTTFYRDSTELSGISIGMQTLVGGNYVYGSHSISWMDSPNTTSEIGYKVYFRTNNGSNTAYYNWSDRGKVHLTVTEIAG